MAKSFGDTESYEKSNKIEKVGKSRLSKKEYKALLESGDDHLERQKAAQALLDYLTATFKIPPVKITVKEKPQAHRDNAKGNLKSKIHGFYTTGVHNITVYNLTAKLEKVVAIKTFSDTVLHEFIHHYDIEYLKLRKSLHTSGFYKRINDLRKKLS